MAIKLIKMLLFFATLFLVLISCNPTKKIFVNLGGTVPEKNEKLKIYVQDYLKNYATCKCIELSFKRDSIKVTEVSSNFLREMADDVITNSTDSLIKKEAFTYVSREQVGSSHVDGITKNKSIANCIFLLKVK